MIKTFYFGSISPETAADWGREDAFEFGGELFEFKVTINFADGMLRLEDSLKRMVPIDSTHYGELFGLMQNVVDFQDKYDSLVEELDELDEISEASFSQTESQNIVTFKG